MILVDPRVGSKELIPVIKSIGVPCDKVPLSFGDAAFSGNGPRGEMAIGIERKALQDMLACIDDARYSAHQKPGMARLYDRSFLIIEGAFKPHDPDGTLMQQYANGQWGELRYRSQRVMYSKLYRYLMSVSLSGVNVLYSRDLYQTAFNICECYFYFQKKWEAHTSLLEVQKLNIPSLNGKPSLVRRWASDLDDIGTILSQEADRVFKTPIQLAQADESQWMRIPRVGALKARNIVKQIWGYNK